MARILITGGAGFLGSHMAERLLARGDEVIVADNFYTGAKRNIAHLMGEPYFELIRHDVTFPLFVEVDGIMNLACPASPVHYQRDPVQTTKTCVHGSINMLGLAKRVDATILQASTSEVYGDPEVHPQPESYVGSVNTVGPRSCYDEGKRCAETLFNDYRVQHGLDTKIARIFNTYGPRMQVGDGRVVSNFIVQALRGEPITVYGDGTQTRSFCYVDDLIGGLVALFDAPKEVSGPINIGNPEEISIGEVAELVADMVGSSAGVTYHDVPKDDPKRRRPDITLARETLGYAPETGLRDGLGRTIEYFRERLAQDEARGGPERHGRHGRG